MCPATPSENPKRPKSRSAPASLCLRCRRSSSTVANVGGVGMTSSRGPRPSVWVAWEPASERACAITSNYRLAHGLPHRRHPRHRRPRREGVGARLRPAPDGGVVARERRRQMGEGRHRPGARRRVQGHQQERHPSLVDHRHRHCLRARQSVRVRGDVGTAGRRQLALRVRGDRLGLPGHRVLGGPPQAVVRRRGAGHGRPQRGHAAQEMEATLANLAAAVE